MPKFIADINIMPLKSLHDPHGKTVLLSLQDLGFKEVSNVRVGKHILLEITADSKEIAMERVNEACNLLLHNPVVEGYEYVLSEIK
jgi:phosphoribosylformylglycinamidine synthase subunit PurS